LHNLYRGNKQPKNTDYICKFQKLPKVKSHPMGENSPNLVTLICRYALIEMVPFLLAW
jgi:hypothetical protein